MKTEQQGEVILFIGGPLDGSRIAVPLPHPVRYCVNTNREKFEVKEYCLFAINATKWKSSHVYIFEDLSCDDADIMLLDSYKR
jgi:hypothetical protein